MDWSGSSRVSCALRSGFDFHFPDWFWKATPVAQRRRHLSYKEAFTAGSSPAGGTAEWTGVRHQHGLISRPHAGSNPASATGWSGSAVAARRPGKRGRPGSTPGRTSLGCSSNRKTPPSQGGNRGAIPRRSTRAGGRKAEIRRPWEPESVGSTPTPLTGCMGRWSNGATPAWRAGHARSTPAGSTA